MRPTFGIALALATGLALLPQTSAAEEESTIHITKTASVSLLKTAIVSVALSPDNTTLATASVDGTVRLWKREDHSLLQTFPGFPGGPAAHWDRIVLFHPKSGMLIAGHSTNSVTAWNWQTGERLWQSMSGARDIAFSVNGDEMFSTDWASRQIRLWDPANGKPKGTIPESAGKPVDPRTGLQGTVTLSPDGNTIASVIGGNTGRTRSAATLTMRDRTTLEETRRFGLGTTAIHALAYSPDGRTLAVGQSRGTIRLFRILEKDERPPNNENPANIEELIAALESPDFAVIRETRGVLLGMGDAARGPLRAARDKATAPESRRRIEQILERIESLENFKNINLKEGDVLRVAFSPNGRLLIACSRVHRGHQGRILFLEPPDYEKPAVAEGKGFTDFALSQDGKLLAVSLVTGDVWYFDIRYSGEE